MTTESTTSVSPPLPSVRRGRRWVTPLLALVVFVAGMASGAALTIHYAVGRLQFAIHHPEVAPARIAATIQRRLRLDDAQTARIEQILARRQVEIAAIRRQFQPQIVEQLAAVREEVAAGLDERQRARWTELFDQFQQRWLPPVTPKNE